MKTLKSMLLYFGLPGISEQTLKQIMNRYEQMPICQNESMHFTGLLLAKSRIFELFCSSFCSSSFQV